MTDPRRPSTDWWIAPLGLALLVASALSSLPLILAWAVAMSQRGYAVVELVMRGLLPAACAVLVIASALGRFSPQLTVRVAFATIVGLAMADLVRYISAVWSSGGSFWAFQTASTLLITVGAPILWGSALARLHHPQQLPLQKFGRIGAGLVQLGFVFQFAVRVRNWNAMNPGSGSPLFALASLADIAGNVLLLWASVEAMRTVPDEDAVRRRAYRTHRLMLASLVLGPITSLLYQAAYDAPFSDSGGVLGTLGRMASYLLLQATTAFVLARWYRLQFPASTSPMDRSGDVQSTGEPS